MEAWSELSCCKPSLGEKHTTLPLLRALFKTFFYFEASFAAVIASIFAVSSWRAIASHDSLQIREDLPFFLQAGTIFAIHAIAIWHVSEASRWARVSGVAARSVSGIARSPTDSCVVARGEEHFATVRGAWQRLVPTGLELDFS